MVGTVGGSRLGIVGIDGAAGRDGTDDGRPVPQATTTAARTTTAKALVA
jgi:hypothetical protein